MLYFAHIGANIVQGSLENEIKCDVSHCLKG